MTPPARGAPDAGRGCDGEGYRQHHRVIDLGALTPEWRIEHGVAINCGLLKSVDLRPVLAHITSCRSSIKDFSFRGGAVFSDTNDTGGCDTSQGTFAEARTTSSEVIRSQRLGQDWDFKVLILAPADAYWWTDTNLCVRTGLFNLKEIYCHYAENFTAGEDDVTTFH